MEKPIDEMAKVLGEIQEFGINRPRDEGRYPVLYPSNKEVADYLISKSYRKASDVAREIIEDLTRMVFSKIPNKLLLISGGRDFTNGIIDGKREAYFDMLNYLAELKKNYESVGGE